MLFPSLLLFIAFTSAFADVEEDIQECLSQVNVEELENLEDLKTDEQLKAACPIILNTFDCVENVLKKETGLTLQDLADLTAGTEIGKGVEVALNVRGIFVDVCTDGSPLNEAYLADAECFDAIEFHVNTCKQKAEEAEEALEGFAENAVEEIDSDEFAPDTDCMESAYLSACVAALIHDTCGRRAFDTYNGIIKRSGVFRNVLCSKEDLEHLQTTFVDRLDIDDSKKDILRLAFDLKKRRK